MMIIMTIRPAKRWRQQSMLVEKKHGSLVTIHNYHAVVMTEKIPVNGAFEIRAKRESSCLEDWICKVDILTLSAPVSTKKVFTFKLTIEDY